MTRLSVNVNKIATLRNARSTGAPSVALGAQTCLDAGAHGITVHPRPDERHIRPDDVRDVADVVRAHPGAELNIEGNPFHGLVEYAERVHPTQCTLVPDHPAQSTSDHGWRLEKDGSRLEPVVARLRALGCRVSLFIDADEAAVRTARDVGADRVELYTGPYAAHAAELPRFVGAAAAARSAGLGVNAGHDLTRANLGLFLGRVPNVLEVSIGHALIADAFELGLASTVRAFLATIADASP